MQAGVQESVRKGVQSGMQSGMQADRYDFDRLERSVEFLLEEHERLSGEREALLQELIDREQRISVLESRLERESTRRITAVEGVDKMLSRLEQLQASISSISETA
jgi:chromosome segregation ATPase